MLQSFPQGAVIIEPGWLAKVKEQDPLNRVAFIEANAAEIQKATSYYFKGNAELKDCGALLGAGNLVQVTNVQRQASKGRLTQTMTVATLLPHSLDGVNLWISSFDPKHPNAVLFSNVLIGKHPDTCLMDFANNKLGKHLMATTWKMVPFSILAEESGRTLDEVLLETAKNEWKQGVKEGGPIGILLNRIIFRGVEKIDSIIWDSAARRTKAGSTLDTKTKTMVMEAATAIETLTAILFAEAPKFLFDIKMEETSAGIMFEEVKLLPEGLMIYTQGPTTEISPEVEKNVRECMIQYTGKDSVSVIQNIVSEILEAPVKHFVEEQLGRRDIGIEVRKSSLATTMIEADVNKKPKTSCPC